MYITKNIIYLVIIFQQTAIFCQIVSPEFCHTTLHTTFSSIFIFISQFHKVARTCKYFIYL